MPRLPRSYEKRRGRRLVEGYGEQAITEQE
jgi:hypothetical protein